MSEKNNIFLALGPDEFLLREFLENYKTAAIEKYGEFSVEKFSLAEHSPATIRNEIFSPAFFGGKRILFIEGFPPSASPKLSEPKKEFFETLITQLPTLPDDVVVIFAQANPDKRTKIFKGLQKIAGKTFSHESFDPKKDGYKFSEWIQERAQKNGSKIDKQSADFLREFCGNNLGNLNSEIQKLALYKGQNGIEVEDIKALALPSEEVADFAFSNAVSSGKQMKVLEEFTDLSEKYDAGMVFNRDVITTLRTLLKIKLAKDAPGISTGLHPFVVRNMQKTAGNISKEKLFEAFNALKEIDLKTKDGRLSLSPDSRGFLLALEKILHDLFAME